MKWVLQSCQFMSVTEQTNQQRQGNRLPTATLTSFAEKVEKAELISYKHCNKCRISKQLKKDVLIVVIGQNSEIGRKTKNMKSNSDNLAYAVIY